MKMIMKEDGYPVKDLYLAAYLYSKNLKLLRLQKEKDFYWFIFQDKEKSEEQIERYWQREAEVNAKIYAEAIRTLKDMIFSRSV